MSLTEIVAERTYQPTMVDQRTLFLRKAIDLDAALVEQLRGGEAEAVVSRTIPAHATRS
jgi:hypothetical protein